MDKFGYIRGKRGPPGPRGKDAVELHTWFPSSTLRMFRENECCRFFFNTKRDGILFNEKGEVLGLKDRNDNHNAICLKNFKKPIPVEDVYGIPLKDTVYRISHIETGLAQPSVFIIAFSFRLLSELTTSESQYIFTNNSGTRAVSLNKDYLDIWGSKASPQLIYNKNTWNIMLVQYSQISNNPGRCFFVLNGERGFFDGEVYDLSDHDIYIGSPKKPTANIVIGNLEIYSKSFKSTPSDYLLPREIYDLILEDFRVRVT